MNPNAAESTTAPAANAPATDARRVYILPTRFGLLFAAALLLMLLLSVNYNNGLAHLFTFLLAGVAVVSMHFTQRNLVGLRISVQPQRPVFLGETALAHAVVEDTMNRARVAVWLRGGEEDVMVDVPRGGRADAEIRFRPSRRGLVPLPDVGLVSTWPLGLLCAWTRPMACRHRQLVYPRPAPPLPLPIDSSGSVNRAPDGRRGGEADFSGLREHRHGDPLSRIHWRASARGTGLVTKQFEGQGRGPLVLSLDDATGGDVEARLGVVCRWVLEAETRALEYALVLPGLRIDQGSGPRQQRRCLEALALWRAP